MRENWGVRMKLVSYRLKNDDAPLRVGFMLDDTIVDGQQAFQLVNGNVDDQMSNSLSNPTSFYQVGQSAIDKVKEVYTYCLENTVDGLERYSRDQVYFGTAVPNPSKVICVGKNYVEHAKEMKSDVPDYPVLFAKFFNALIGADDTIEKTPLTEKLDYEAELTVVIGKEASRVKREEALDYVAGYTLGNDISARDLQKRTPQWLQGKSVDRSTPVGPWVVTADEVGDPGSLDIRCYVNGEERQASNTEKLIFDIPFLIEFISGIMTLNPGDIIMTGTPDGVAFGMESPKFLQAGDAVAVEIEKIGRMENKVQEGN